MNLVAEIDGRHIRLALADSAGQLSHAFEAPMPALLAPLLRAWLLRIGAPALRGFACAVAGQVDARDGDDPQLGPDELLAASGAPRAWLLDPVAALAHAVPALGTDDVQSVAAGLADPLAPCMFVDPGSELAVALALRGAEGWRVVISDVGQADLAPLGDRETSVWQALAGDGEPLDTASLLSVPGFRRVYRVLEAVTVTATKTGAAPAPIDDAAAAAEDDPIARETQRLFSRWLGRAVGTLALQMDARGGVFVGGGLFRDCGVPFDAAEFRHGFEAAVPLQAIPCSLVTNPQALLIGLAQVASDASPVPAAGAS
jgi:glucokinase